MIHASLSRQPLSLSEWNDDSSGAVVRFTGTVRALENGVPISALEYAAYEPMAVRVLEQMLTAIASTHGLTSARVIHRIGIVPVGEAAVIVEVSAAHRGKAFEAITRFMDRLKEDVPIWKVRSLSVP